MLVRGVGCRPRLWEWAVGNREKGSTPACQSVTVSLGPRSYEIKIGAGLLGGVGPSLAQLGFSGKAAVVTDRSIARLYGSTVTRSLKRSGFQTHAVVLPAGERAKTLRGVSVILDQLVKHRFERGSLLVALGGGVVGDMTGFAASVYVRGIPFVQIPTTLVSQVDSSVGGKTGVNHALGKNLIGTFHQPHLVLIDPETLRTLPRREWLGGLAEVIKYGMIADEQFFDYLEQHTDNILRMDPNPIAHLIRRSCEIKAEVVAKDEREADRRRILNYGHTIGHALEALGRYRSLIHGEAVAIGMVQEAELAHSMDLCGRDVITRQRSLIRRMGLPDALPPITSSALWGAMQRDKKVVRGRLHCVLPERVGQVAVAPLTASQFKHWFRNRRRHSG